MGSIAERDAISLGDRFEGMRVLVTDARDDASVDAGWAEYVWINTPGEWVKLTEGESLDLVLDWSNVENRPTSSTADIDSAVAQKHSHSNKSILDATTASFTTALKATYDDAVAKEHTHSNKSILDATTASFTTALLNSVNDSAGKAHVHANAAILNATSASFTTSLKATYDAKAYIEVGTNEPTKKDFWFEEV